MQCKWQRHPPPTTAQQVTAQHSAACTLAASYSDRSGLIFSVRRSYAAYRLAWLNCSLQLQAEWEAGERFSAARQQASTQASASATIAAAGSSQPSEVHAIAAQTQPCPLTSPRARASSPSCEQAPRLSLLCPASRPCRARCPAAPAPPPVPWSKGGRQLAMIKER